MRPPIHVRELASRISNVAMLSAIGAIGLLVAWTVYSTDYIKRVAAGPEPISLGRLTAALNEAHNGKWLDVTTDVPAQHLLRTTTTRRRGSPSITNHFVLFTNSVAQIVETGKPELPARFLAWASDFDAASDYYTRATRQLNVWAAGRGNIPPLSPVLLKVSDTVTFTRGALFGALSLSVLAAVFLAWRAARLKTDYTRVPPIARLRKSARAPDGLPFLVAEIDRELASIDPAAQRRGVFILPHWLIEIERNSFKLMSAQDVIWIVPYTVKTKFYGFTTSKRDVVQVIDRNRQKIAIATVPDQLDNRLGHLHRWAPWAVVGENADMEAQFGSKAKLRWPSRRKRARLIETVDIRRASLV